MFIGPFVYVAMLWMLHYKAMELLDNTACVLLLCLLILYYKAVKAKAVVSKSSHLFLQVLHLSPPSTVLTSLKMSVEL